jgi:hypothetical protein
MMNGNQHPSSRSDDPSMPPPLPIYTVDPLQPPPLPVQSLNYFGRTIVPGWVVIDRPPTTGQWHRAKAALGRGHIETLMGKGSDAPDGDAAASRNDEEIGIELLVRETDAPRARLILEAIKVSADWCPLCGSISFRLLPVPWWWIPWSIIFLGVAPFAPKRFEYKSRGHRWE